MVAVVPKTWRKTNVRCVMVGMVMSVWVGAKKPKLATTAVSINHCVAFRLVEMSNVPGCDQYYECSDRSTAYMLQPHTVVCVLDVESATDASAKCRVTLSQDSVLAVSRLETVADWWPTLETSDPKDASSRGDLYLSRRRGKKRARRQKKGGGNGTSETKKAADKKVKENSKKKN